MEELTGLSGASPQERLRSVGASLVLVLFAFLSGLLLAFVVAQVAIVAGLPVEQNRVYQVVLLLPAQFVGFLIPLFAYLYSEDRLDLIRARLPTLRDIGWALGGIGALFVGVLAIGAVIQYLGVSTATNSGVEAARENPAVIPFFVVMSILIVGPCEELLFRGGVQGILRESYAPIPAIVIASALFGVAHVAALLGSDLTGQVTYIAIAFILGMILGFLYERTENIVVPMLTHGIYNAILFGSLAFG